MRARLEALLYVALIDFTMYHPFGHCLSWAAHEADAIFHDSSKQLALGQAPLLDYDPSAGRQTDKLSAL